MIIFHQPLVTITFRTIGWKRFPYQTHCQKKTLFRSPRQKNLGEAKLLAAEPPAKCLLFAL